MTVKTQTRKNMKIAFIGAGRVATNLSRALLEAGHDIVQVYSRTMASAQEMAENVGGSPTDDLNRLTHDADVYIFSVKDDALGELIPQVCKGREQKVFLHTAGSMPMDVFKGMALHYGVLYPLQTFSKDREVDFHEVPCFVEVSDEFSAHTIVALATAISNHVSPLSSADRKYLHLAAVFASNFANHCYAIAADILDSHGLPFNVMLPLIDETTSKVHDMTPYEAQTGPALRYDENVMRQQRQLLGDNPFAKDLYDRMSMSIHKKALKRKQ